MTKPRIKEISSTKAIGYSLEPDGLKLPVIDAYDGCSISCPYCIQWNDLNWNKEIVVKTNFPDLLRSQLKNWDKSEIVYIGDRCDPYLSIEQEYELTRKSLITLRGMDIPCLLCTKASNDLTLRDIDIFLDNPKRFQLVIGLSNINEIQKNKDLRTFKNIINANKLFESGVNIHVFIAPFLPGITDVHKIIDALNPNIKISIDLLWAPPEQQHTQRLLSFIKLKYPFLIDTYKQISYENKNEEYDAIYNEFQNSKQISFLRYKNWKGQTGFELNKNKEFELNHYELEET